MAGVLAVLLAARPDAQPTKAGPAKAIVSNEQRLDALSRAAVWTAPRASIASVALKPAHEPRSLSCRFKVSSPGGTAPKFDCTLETGERIRVKYGRSPEIPSEVASARLLNALGFGADEVMIVEQLQCYGCPKEPFVTMKALGFVESEDIYKTMINYSAAESFEWVAVERKHPARPSRRKTSKAGRFSSSIRLTAAAAVLHAPTSTRCG